MFVPKSKVEHKYWPNFRWAMACKPNTPLGYVRQRTEQDCSCSYTPIKRPAFCPFNFSKIFLSGSAFTGLARY
jgi:hypothetical protein